MEYWPFGARQAAKARVKGTMRGIGGLGAGFVGQLGAATREHTLLVGPPGVGKSLLCRRLGALFSESDSYFEVALTRFTTLKLSSEWKWLQFSFFPQCPRVSQNRFSLHAPPPRAPRATRRPAPPPAQRPTARSGARPRRARRACTVDRGETGARSAIICSRSSTAGQIAGGRGKA